MDIIGMSISGSVVILLVIILRRIFFKSIPSKLIKFLWLAAAAKLLVQFGSLPYVSTVISSGSVRRYSLEAIGENIYAAQNGLCILIDVSLSEPLKYLWLFGAVFTGALFFFNHIKTKRMFSCALPCGYDIEPLKKSFKIRRKVVLVTSEMTDTPFTYGIIRPKIILPKTIDFSDKKMIDNILCHELGHIKCLDILFKLVMIICLSVHWFNPLVWVMMKLSDKDIEFACDETAISHRMSSRREYAMTLINMEEHRCSYYAAGFTGGGLEERITRIMAETKPRRSYAAGTAAVLMTVMAAVCVRIISTGTMNHTLSESAEAVSASEVSENAAESVYYYDYAEEEVTESVKIASFEKNDTIYEVTVIAKDSADLHEIDNISDVVYITTTTLKVYEYADIPTA